MAHFYISYFFLKIIFKILVSTLVAPDFLGGIEGANCVGGGWKYKKKRKENGSLLHLFLLGEEAS